MDDLKISWRNIWRNKRRSFLTILAIVFAATILVFMLSFQLGSYEDMINASVKLDTGHIQIMAKEYNDDKKIRTTINNPEEILLKVEKLNSVQGASIRSETFCLVSSENRSKGVFIAGVNPDQEKKVSRLYKSIQKGSYLNSNDYDKAIIGYLLAKRLKIQTGDEITILGQAKDGSVAAGIAIVKGIFKSGIDEFDKNIIQVPFEYFNDIFYMQNSAHKIVVLLNSIKSLEKTQNKILLMVNQKSIDVLNWEELIPGLKQSINLDLISGFIMYIILIIVVAFSILNTFLMSILERKKEYGVLLAIGTTPQRLVKFVLTESMLMTGAGLVIGIITGAGVTLYFSYYGIGVGEASEMLSQYGISDRLYPKLSLISLFTGPFLILITTFFTALIPALKIKKLKPVEAMNSI